MATNYEELDEGDTGSLELSYSSSNFESDIEEELENVNGIQPFLYEPIIDEENESMIAESQQVSQNLSESRLNNTDWYELLL